MKFSNFEFFTRKIRISRQISFMGRVRILGKKSFFEKSYGFSETSPFYFFKTQGHRCFEFCFIRFSGQISSMGVNRKKSGFWCPIYRRIPRYWMGYIVWGILPIGSILIFWLIFGSISILAPGSLLSFVFWGEKGLQILFDLFHQRQSRHPCLIDISSDSLILAIVRASRGVRTG